MSLSSTEKAYLAEILQIPHPDLVAGELLELLMDQETILKADIARWQVIRGQYGSLNGHNDSGVEFNPADERSDIKKRCIAILNCASIVNAYRAARGSGGRVLRA